MKKQPHSAPKYETMNYDANKTYPMIINVQNKIEFRISLGAPIRLTMNLIEVFALPAKNVKISD